MLAGKAKLLADVTSSMEHYLMAVHELRAEKGYARVSDIAEKLGVAKATVSKALMALSERRLVRHASYGIVELNEEGDLRARQVLNRFRVLNHFLQEVLGIESGQARQEACLAEHVIGARTVDRLIDFIKFLEHDAPEAKGLLDRFRRYRRACESGQPCELCGTDRCEVLRLSEKLAVAGAEAAPPEVSGSKRRSGPPRARRAPAAVASRKGRR